MRILKISIVLLVIGLLISCSSGKEEVRKQGPKEEVPKQLQPEHDKVYARYPKYRIDDKIQKICIIGSGDGQNEVTYFFTKYFITNTNVKVVEAGNLQAILGGKIIEYGTGLSFSDSQALSQMLQIDHILLFEEKVSPHRDYQFGGKGFVTINLKIVNTLNGEVLFQSFGSIGLLMKDPRGYGYRKGNTEMPTNVVRSLRSACLYGMVYELSYAMGDFTVGIYPKHGGNIIGVTIVNSVADRAGVKIGDKIVEVNGKTIELQSDIPRKGIKQGDDVKIKVERESKIIELNGKIPIIPFRPEEEKKEKSKDKKIQL